MPIFPEDSNSLLKKHLTQEMWRKYHDKKDGVNFPFKSAIFSGCKNTDSGIGVYAGSESSYTAFKDFFDAII